MEGIVHIDDERVVQLSEDLAFVHDRLNRPLGNDASLRHFLHSIWLLGLLALHLPHLAKATLADAVHVVEVGLCESFED